jgi:hypothetical protein
LSDPLVLVGLLLCVVHHGDQNHDHERAEKHVDTHENLFNVLTLFVTSIFAWQRAVVTHQSNYGVGGMCLQLLELTNDLVQSKSERVHKSLEPRAE